MNRVRIPHRLAALPAILLALITVVPPAYSAAPAAESRVVVDVAFLLPRGELAEDFDPVTRGLGAGPGYEVGFRYRLPVTNTFFVSPGFHFVDFEDQIVLDPGENEYATEAYSYRFTVDCLWMPVCGKNPVRPFAAVGAGLYRDRVVGYWGDIEGEVRNESSNTFGYRLRLGFATESFEVALVAHRNDVDTPHFFDTGASASYRWNSLGAQASYLLPW